MTDWNELAERVEAATGPDRELDEQINFAIGYEGYLPTPYFTASIDAALTLVPEGWDWLTGTATAGAYGHAYLRCIIDHSREIEQEAATPALALCAASLKARDNG